MQSLEEAQGILQTFPDSYKARFDEEIDLSTVETFLISMLNKQKHEHIERAFSGLNTHSIKVMLEAINNLKQASNPRIDENTKYQPKPPKKSKKCAPTQE